MSSCIGGGSRRPASRPRDVRSLADLRQLPFTVKTDLRDHYPFGLFARPLDSLARLHASSGTTGKPTVVGYTRADLHTWAELMARTLRCAGARPGDVIHNAYGYGLFTGGLGAHYGAERLGGVVVPVSGGSTERQVALIVDFGARVLCSTPSYALAIAEVAEQMGVDLRKSGAARGPVRRRALERDDAPRDSRRGSGCRRSTTTGCPRSWARAWRSSARSRTVCTAGRTTSCSR